MDRDWRLVIDINVGGLPKDVLAALERDFDVDREDRTILCYGVGDDPSSLTDRVLRRLAEADLVHVVIRPFAVERWSEDERRYLDAETPDDEDDSWSTSALSPGEIRWLVRVKPVSVFEERRARHEVRALGRPITGSTRSGFDVGAQDRDDAMALTVQLSDLPHVASATPRSLGRLRRWLFRQRLLGNYWSESGEYFTYHDGGFLGGEGGGAGGDGGGGHGH
jgi:hypothetical protein